MSWTYSFSSYLVDVTLTSIIVPFYILDLTRACYKKIYRAISLKLNDLRKQINYCFISTTTMYQSNNKYKWKINIIYLLDVLRQKKCCFDYQIKNLLDHRLIESHSFKDSRRDALSSYYIFIAKRLLLLISFLRQKWNW